MNMFLFEYTDSSGKVYRSCQVTMPSVQKYASTDKKGAGLGINAAANQQTRYTIRAFDGVM